jgi:DNA repair protein SbcD/Mre11
VATVRILHTSDWHIGRRFEHESLEADQRAFLDWLAAQVGELAVDLVIVAGDVYDRSMPAEDAVALLDHGLEAVRSAGATVAVISGNHDSARRLGFGARRQALGGVHVFADDRNPPAPWIFRAGGEEVAVVAVPYLDPLTVPAPLPADDGIVRPRTHEHVLADALCAGRAALGAFGSVPSVAVAHATVAGASTSESERTLAIGGADAVGAGLFEGFDYVALGHLHRPQVVAGSDRIAYSGSPLPYSFSETGPKSVRLVEVGGAVVSSVREVPVPVGRPVTTLEATLDRLLSDPGYDRFLDHWVAACLTDQATQVQPLERLRRRFPHAVSVRYARPRQAWAGAGAAPVALAGRSTEEVVVDFLAELWGNPPEGWARELVLEAVDAVHREAPR